MQKGTSFRRRSRTSLLDMKKVELELCEKEFRIIIRIKGTVAIDMPSREFAELLGAWLNYR